jgi:hypothetical protein
MFSCPEGPTRLDRETRVGAPARRADGPGRRTAGRWVCATPVAVVRFTRPSGRRTRLSRARLGKAKGVPRGTDDPQGPNRPGAGGFARRSTGRGSWGLSFSSSSHPHGCARARISHRPRRYPPVASAVPVPAGHRSYSSGRPHGSAPLVVNSVVRRCRPTAGSGPVLVEVADAVSAPRLKTDLLHAMNGTVAPSPADTTV